jgi:hypothetical protein
VDAQPYAKQFGCRGFRVDMLGPNGDGSGIRSLGPVTGVDRYRSDKLGRLMRKFVLAALLLTIATLARGATPTGAAPEVMQSPVKAALPPVRGNLGLIFHYTVADGASPAAPADLTHIFLPINAQSGNATIGIGCYYGQIQITAGSGAIALYNHPNGDMFQAITNGATGRNNEIGKVYQLTVPGDHNSPYRGTITSYTSRNTVGLSNVPSGGVPATLSGVEFCWGAGYPTQVAKLTAGQTLLFYNKNAGTVFTDALINKVSLDGFHVRLSSSGNYSSNEVMQITVGTDASLAFNAAVAAARGSSPVDRYLGVTGCNPVGKGTKIETGLGYLVLSPINDATNLIKVSPDGCVLEGVPTGQGGQDLVRLTVANILQPPRLPIENAFPSGSFPPGSFARAAKFGCVGDSIEADGDNPLSFVDSECTTAFREFEEQRALAGLSYPDTYADYGIGGQSYKQMCSDVPAPGNSLPGQLSVSTTLKGDVTGQNTIVVISAAGISNHMAMAWSGQAAGTTFYVTNISGTIVSLSGKVSIPSGTMLNFATPWLGTDAYGGIVHDAKFDGLIVGGNNNSGYATNPADFVCVMNKIAGWSNKTYPILSIHWPFSGGGQAVPSFYNTFPDSGEFYGSFVRGYSRWKGIPLIDFQRIGILATLGVDPMARRFVRNQLLPPSLNMEFHYALPWTALAPPGTGYSSVFQVDNADNVTYKGAVSLFSNWGGGLKIRIGSSFLDAGNEFILGFDKETGYVTYRINASNSLTLIPTTDSTVNISGDISSNIYLLLVVSPSTNRLVVQLGLGGTGVSNINSVYDGPCLCLGGPFQFSISSIGGGGNNLAEAYDPLSKDTLFATEQPDRVYVPVLLDEEIAGCQAGASSTDPVLCPGQYGLSDAGIEGGNFGNHPTTWFFSQFVRPLLRAQHWVSGQSSATRVLTTDVTLQAGDIFVHLKNQTGSNWTITLPQNPQINYPYTIEEDAGDTHAVTFSPSMGLCNGGIACTSTTAYGSHVLNFDGMNWTMH